MKRINFLFVFFTFLRLQIYEAIAAIFWQSASYGLQIAVDEQTDVLNQLLNFLPNIRCSVINICKISKFKF